jgi:hypothetical protein
MEESASNYAFKLLSGLEDRQPERGPIGNLRKADDLRAGFSD